MKMLSINNGSVYLEIVRELFHGKNNGENYTANNEYHESIRQQTMKEELLVSLWTLKAIQVNPDSDLLFYI